MALGSDSTSYVEPYLRVGYDFDYSYTKVSGGANDPDALPIAVGASLFLPGVRGSLEARSTLLRRQEWNLGILGAVRMDF